MRCPICGTKVFKTLDTRINEVEGAVIRRKLCGNNHTFKSEERVLVSKPKASGVSKTEPLPTLRHR